MPSPPTIAPVLVAELLVEGEQWPVYVHVIDHPDARVLVDTGMTELHPAVADLDPRLHPLSEQAFDLVGVDVVVNTHLHFDHCGGNHLFAGRPIYVQRRELDDARSEDDYTIREWVEAPGVRYVPVDGEHELLPGLRLVPASGHTRGMQVVVVETGGRPVVVGGDVAVSFGELDEPRTEGQLRVRALNPELVWLAHEHEPWRPSTTRERSLRLAPRSGQRVIGRAVRLASDGVEGGVVDGVDGAVGADEGGGVGLGARAVEVDLLGQHVPGQVPAVDGSVLAVHDHRVVGGVDHGRVDAPLIACSGGRRRGRARATGWSGRPS